MKCIRVHLMVDIMQDSQRVMMMMMMLVVKMMIAVAKAKVKAKAKAVAKAKAKVTKAKAKANAEAKVAKAKAAPAARLLALKASLRRPLKKGQLVAAAKRVRKECARTTDRSLVYLL
jgi:hypothetical protein